MSDNGIRKIKDLEHTVRVKDLDIKGQKQSIQTLSAGARGSFTMIKSSEKRLEELGAKIREHEAEWVEWKSEKVISEGLHAQIKDENETLEAEAAESGREIEELKNSNVSLRQRIKASQKKIGKVSSQRLLHQRGARKAKAATSRLAKRVIELKKLDRDHNAHAKEKDKVHNTGIKEKNNTITLLNSKIHHLESTISSVQQQANSQTDKQTAYLQARIDTITQRFNTVEIELQTTKATLKTTAVELSTALKAGDRKDVMIRCFKDLKQQTNERLGTSKNTVQGTRNENLQKRKQEVIVLNDDDKEGISRPAKKGTMARKRGGRRDSTMVEEEYFPSEEE